MIMYNIYQQKENSTVGLIAVIAIFQPCYWKYDSLSYIMYPV